MSKKKTFADLFAPETRDVEYWTERAIIEFTEEMCRCMEEQGISRAELARRLDVSPAYVTKILRGNYNFTLESMVKVACALKAEFRTHLQPEDAYSAWFDFLPEVESTDQQTDVSLAELDSEYCTLKCSETTDASLFLTA